MDIRVQREVLFLKAIVSPWFGRTLLGWAGLGFVAQENVVMRVDAHFFRCRA